MKCKNCKADNKQELICDAGVACYVLRCGEYGCALNGKTVDRLLRMKKYVTNADRLRRMSDEEFATAICKHDGCPFREAEDDECLKYHYDCKACWLGWLRQEAE